MLEGGNFHSFEISRLDAGHDVHQLPQSAKDAVPEHILRKAREIGQAEYKKRLKVVINGLRSSN